MHQFIYCFGELPASYRLDYGFFLTHLALLASEWARALGTLGTKGQELDRSS